MNWKVWQRRKNGDIISKGQFKDIVKFLHLVISDYDIKTGKIGGKN